MLRFGRWFLLIRGCIGVVFVTIGVIIIATVTVGAGLWFEHSKCEMNREHYEMRPSVVMASYKTRDSLAGLVFEMSRPFLSLVSQPGCKVCVTSGSYHHQRGREMKQPLSGMPVI
jgi:hypothetical protein